MRTWQFLIWNGKRYIPACGFTEFKARGPKDALRIAGLDDDMWDIKYSRKGYGYFTGRIEVRDPVTVAASTKGLPLPADFVLRVISR